jgi:SAM-dependent methyltransferase
MNRSGSLDALVELAREHEAEGGERLPHLDSFRGARRYVKDAELIARLAGPGKSLLDLGCGVGQMSFLLAPMGYDVTASDIVAARPYYLRKLAERHGIEVPYVPCNVLESENHALAGRRFEVVCLSGVLEHVPDFSLFLRRVKQLLASDGKLFVFRFPNLTSWIEWINDHRMGNAATHPLRFSLEEISVMLRWHGFRLDEGAYEEILPVNMRFAGIPRPVISVYQALGPVLAATSTVLCRVPLLNRLSTSFRLVATRARTKS